MFTEERQEKILALLSEKSSVTVPELVERFGVSAETVRRDLLALEGEKRLIRVHGGARSITGNAHRQRFDERHAENRPAKRELSEAAAEFIEEGDVIAVDSGSTSVEFCQVLKERFERLVVITNSLMLFHILEEKEHFQIILCGGDYRRDESCFYGLLTLHTIRSLHASKAFLCPTGVSLEYGFTDFTQEFVQLQQAMREISDKCFVLADSTKFEIGGLYQVFPLQDDLTLITDHRLENEVYNRYLQADIDIIRGNEHGKA